MIDGIRQTVRSAGAVPAELTLGCGRILRADQRPDAQAVSVFHAPRHLVLRQHFGCQLVFRHFCQAGRGQDPRAGLSDAGLVRKIAAIRQALAINRPDRSDPADVMAKAGGFELAGMTGAFLGGMKYGIESSRRKSLRRAAK